MIDCVVISGANSGIGLAVSRCLAEAGYAVVAGYRSAAGRTALETLSLANIHPVRLDICKDSDIEAVGQFLAAKPQWRLKALINNAGIALTNTLAECDREEMQHVFNTNVFGHLQLTRQLLPKLKESGGRIVNIGSTNCQVPGVLNGSYSSSKAALRMLSRVLDIELAQTKVRSICVKPGVVATPHWLKIAAHEETSNIQMDSLPDGRLEQLRTLASEGRNSPDKMAADLRKIIETPFPRADYTLGRDAKIRLFIFSLLPPSLHRWLTARRN